MTDPLRPECYELESGQPLPNDVLGLWYDDPLSDQHGPNLMSGDGNPISYKAAGRWASPDVVARFSRIPGATAKIEKRGYSTDYWVIRGPAAA
jgi:hypothetical protein